MLENLKSKEVRESIKLKVLKVLRKTYLSVEAADIEISNLFRKMHSDSHGLSQYTFFSEEDHLELRDEPLLILDPIDGTREFRMRVSECCLSLSIINGLEVNSKGIHWLWNFFNGDEAFLDREKVLLQGLKRSYKKEKKFLSFISREDFKNYKLENFSHPLVEFLPMGSIAYKLAHLAGGNGDFVLSLSNKSIWDISAGTAILKQMNFRFENMNGAIKAYDSKLVKGPFFWAKKNCSSQFLKELIQSIILRKDQDSK